MSSQIRASGGGAGGRHAKKANHTTGGGGANNNNTTNSGGGGDTVATSNNSNNNNANNNSSHNNKKSDHGGKADKEKIHSKPTADQIRIAQITDVSSGQEDPKMREKVANLMEMTQRSEEEVCCALSECDNDLNRAVIFLLETLPVVRCLLLFSKLKRNSPLSNSFVCNCLGRLRDFVEEEKEGSRTGRCIWWR